LAEESPKHTGKHLPLRSNNEKNGKKRTYKQAVPRGFEKKVACKGSDKVVCLMKRLEIKEGRGRASQTKEEQQK